LENRDIKDINSN